MAWTVKRVNDEKDDKSMKERREKGDANDAMGCVVVKNRLGSQLNVL